MKHMIHPQLFFTFSLLMIISNVALGIATPQPSRFDPHIQYITYNKDDIIRITTKIGIVTLIQLEDGETLKDKDTPTGLGIGDAKAWNINVKGNNIFLKPAAFHPDTNMTIVTDRRTYSFLLTMPNQTGQPDTTTYILRFKYPVTQEKRAEKLEEENKKKLRAVINYKEHLNPDIYNKNYMMQGDIQLAPDAAWDDGRFTYFRYNSAKALPAFYKILPDGTETLLNMHISEDTVVIHETAHQFMLRMGKAVLKIENDGFDPNGSFNRSGTTVKNTVRIERGSNE